MKRILLTFLLPVGCLLSRCRHTAPDGLVSVKDIVQITNSMSNLMLHDVTNPPLAARFFSYTYLAGYEVIAENDPAYPTMTGVLNDYPKIKKPDLKNFYYPLAALFSMLNTARNLQPSGKLLETNIEQLKRTCLERGMDAAIVNASEQYGRYVSAAILQYARADHYRNISNYPRYTPIRQEGCWYPTPPGFFAAVEPYFNRVRPFLLSSAAMFRPVPPVGFSKNKGSSFYKLMQASYTVGNTLTPDQKAIAAFWDCNPFALQDNGHFLIGLKKISPGAHWLGITGSVCQSARVSFNKALFIHAAEAVTLMDAFICCWDEKFRSNRIRPETAIRKYIDDGWMPLLQTPPFPEYLSGHATISAASAEVLTYFFGDDYSFADSVEVSFGLPVRHFRSFRQAAEEAAISRFYGGIHFTDAVNEGLRQGHNVGRYAIDRIKGFQNKARR